MNKRPLLLTACAAIVAATGLWLATSWATDVGVLGARLALQLNTRTGRASVVSVQRGGDVHVGAAPAPADLSGRLEVYYVDAPGNASVLPMPAPWATTNAKSAKYVNRFAPGGPSPVKNAMVQFGKLGRVMARDLGGIDLTTPPGPGGVVTVLTIDNAADGSRHRMCTLYAPSVGSVVQHRVTPTGYRLLARRGVPTTCPSCADGMQNGDETDVDCGGPDASCARCATGASCVAGSDCASGVCTDDVCQAPACNDGVRNGDETDVDCGGGTCGGCEQGKACEVGTDCVGLVCTEGVCQPESCADGVQNGNETDVDCGGSCAVCPDVAGCSVPPDCQSGVCTGDVCRAPACDDGVKNGSETALDCGGPCAGCAAGEACNVGADCASGVCTGNVCQAPTCSDGVENGAETDVDCGGPSCGDCAVGQGCASGGDCVSGVCTGNVCQAPTCSDGVKNGTETDVDCGGPTCNQCALNQVCATSTDCQTNFCTGNRCKCPMQDFTFQVDSNGGGLFDSAEWPGGTATQSGPPGCSVTINRPNNNVDLVCTLGAPFSVNSFTGYSTCFGTGGEDGDGCQPVSCPPAGIGSCCSGRPSCSAALNGSARARYFVRCNP